MPHARIQGQHSYRWVIVAAGGILGCVAIGAMFSLPVFLLPISRDTGWSVTGVSSAMTIGFVALALASMVWGPLSDRWGPRPVVLIGTVVLAGALAWASRATSLIEFQLVFGLAVGGAAAAIFAPMMACVTGWFDTHRSLAVSLVSAGMGMAPITMSPLAAWLVSNYDWRTSLLIIAVLVAAVMIPVALLVRRPPALEAQNAVTASDGVAKPAMSVGQALRSPQFIILLLTNFFCCATHSGPIFHTVSYAITCGIPMIAAVSIYSIEGLAGMGGRVAFGLLGDRFGAKHILVWGLFVQAFARPGLCLRSAAWCILRRGGASGVYLRRCDAALRRSGAREFPVADDGHRDRRNSNGRQPGHGDRPSGGRFDLRHFRQLQLALCRRLGHWNRCLPDCPDLQAFPQRPTSTGGSLE